VLCRTFAAGFTIGLMTKDLAAARDLAAEVGLDVPPHGDREVVRGRPRRDPR
jgi:3-hydroxyisobutyrate dehydrogenase-like beta-hydroxyacid dehydrogenase